MFYETKSYTFWRCATFFSGDYFLHEQKGPCGFCAKPLSIQKYSVVASVPAPAPVSAVPILGIAFPSVQVLPAMLISIPIGLLGGWHGLFLPSAYWLSLQRRATWYGRFRIHLPLDPPLSVDLRPWTAGPPFLCCRPVCFDGIILPQNPRPVNRPKCRKSRL